VAERKAKAQVPQWTEVQLDQLKVGQPVLIGEAEGRVQSKRGSFALVTTRLDETEASGARGMKGNLGNRSKDGKPGCTCKAPNVAGNFLFAFIGQVPADFAGAPQSGTICGTCDRAVVTQS
jgi:hypothetical protein